jgi:hypothetical protein
LEILQQRTIPDSYCGEAVILMQTDGRIQLRGGSVQIN